MASKELDALSSTSQGEYIRENPLQFFKQSGRDNTHNSTAPSLQAPSDSNQIPTIWQKQGDLGKYIFYVVPISKSSWDCIESLKLHSILIKQS